MSASDASGTFGEVCAATVAGRGEKKAIKKNKENNSPFGPGLEMPQVGLRDALSLCHGPWVGPRVGLRDALRP